MKKENISITVAIIALVMGISAICIAAYRTPVLSFDYLGVIIGAQSILVTALIGWQIYTVIDIKQKIAEAKKYADESMKVSSGKMQRTIKAYTAFLMAESENRKGAIEESIEGYFSAIEFATEEDSTPSTMAISSLFQIVAFYNARGIQGHIYESQRVRYMGLLSTIEKTDKYKEDIPKLIDFILQCQGR